MSDTKTIYIDVRGDDEWARGHVKGAIHFSLDRLMSGELPDIPKDSDVRIYCHSGARAEIAKEILEKAGFSNIDDPAGLDFLRVAGVPIE